MRASRPLAERFEEKVDRVNGPVPVHRPELGQIRRAWAAGEKHETLARRFGVRQPNISRIVHGVTWRVA